MFSVCHMLCTLFSQMDEFKLIHKRNMGDSQKAVLTTFVIFVAHDMFKLRLMIIVCISMRKYQRVWILSPPSSWPFGSCVCLILPPPTFSLATRKKKTTTKIQKVFEECMLIARLWFCLASIPLGLFRSFFFLQFIRFSYISSAVTARSEKICPACNT